MYTIKFLKLKFCQSVIQAFEGKDSFCALEKKTSIA